MNFRSYIIELSTLFVVPPDKETASFGVALRRPAREVLAIDEPDGTRDIAVQTGGKLQIPNANR
jgi:hypothetical protein